MDPGIVAGPDKACVLLFHSEDCSEIGGKNVDSSTIDAMEVDILGDYGLCWIFTDDGTKYSSYIANTGSCDEEQYHIINGTSHVR